LISEAQQELNAATADAAAPASEQIVSSKAFESAIESDFASSV